MRMRPEVFALLTKDALFKLRTHVEEGCGNNIPKGYGDCSYISTAGNLRLCKKCRKWHNQIKEELEKRRKEK